MKVEKLTYETFHMWKQNTGSVLSYREREDVVDPSCSPARDEPEILARHKNDRKDMAIIGLSLSDEGLSYVNSAPSSSDICRSILDIFEKHPLLNELTSRCNWYTATMSSDEAILAFTNWVRTLGATLAGMGVSQLNMGWQTSMPVLLVLSTPSEQSGTAARPSHRSSCEDVLSRRSNVRPSPLVRLPHSRFMTLRSCIGHRLALRLGQPLPTSEQDAIIIAKWDMHRTVETNQLGLTGPVVPLPQRSPQ